MTQLRVGLVGSGGITGVHVPAWLELGAEITVFSLEGAEELAQKHSLGVANSLDELFDECEIVDICTPTSSHKAIAVAAAKAGKHVVCEKPLGRDVAESREIVAAVAEAGTMLFPAHVVRYFPAYKAAKNAVDAGRLGNLGVLRFTRGGAGPRSEWFYDAGQSGGIIADQMIHDLDQARWLAGEVTSVYAIQNAVPLADQEEGTLPRCVTAHVTMTHASGAISHMQGTWGPPGMAFQTSFSIAGDAGTLAFNSAEDSSLSRNLVGGPSTIRSAARHESPFLSEIRDFLHAFEGKSSARVCIDDGVVAVALAQAALESLETGRRVAVSEADILSSGKAAS